MLSHLWMWILNSEGLILTDTSHHHRGFMHTSSPQPYQHTMQLPGCHSLTRVQYHASSWCRLTLWQVFKFLLSHQNPEESDKVNLSLWLLPPVFFASEQQSRTFSKTDGSRQTPCVLITGFSAIYHPKRHKSTAWKPIGKDRCSKYTPAERMQDAFQMVPWEGLLKILVRNVKLLKAIKMQIWSLSERTGF